MAVQEPEVDLISGEEEQVAKSQVRYHPDRCVEVDPAQYRGADDYTADDLEYHGRHLDGGSRPRASGTTTATVATNRRLSNLITDPTTRVAAGDLRSSPIVFCPRRTFHHAPSLSASLVRPHPSFVARPGRPATRGGSWVWWAPLASVARGRDPSRGPGDRRAEHSASRGFRRRGFWDGVPRSRPVGERVDSHPWAADPHIVSEDASSGSFVVRA